MTACGVDMLKMADLAVNLEKTVPLGTHCHASVSNATGCCSKWAARACAKVLQSLLLRRSLVS